MKLIKLGVFCILASILILVHAEIDRSKLPEPDSGIQIIPMLESGLPPAFIKRAMRENEEMRMKGFLVKKSDSAQQLLSISKDKFMKHESHTYLKDTNPMDTHLKSNLNQLKIAFPYKGISFINPKYVIGFAAEGAYKDGWSGVTEAFYYPSIGNCNYNLHNMKISHGGVKLFQEYITYDINAKPSIINVEGTPGMGFSYNIEWFDSDFAHRLTCAQHEYSKETVKKMTELAKKLDLEQS